jgi:hypothetical protein
MSSNLLKLNQDKSELIVFAPKNRVKQMSDFKPPFDGTILSDPNCAKNLGVFFVKSLYSNTIILSKYIPSLKKKL